MQLTGGGLVAGDERDSNKGERERQRDRERETERERENMHMIKVMGKVWNLNFY